LKGRSLSRHCISTRLRLCALALLLPMGAPQAQPGGAAADLQSRAVFVPPDPASFGKYLESGDIAKLREWLDAGLDPDYLADRIGTGLMIAAWRGDIPMMELLVARGADVNKANALGERALMHAAWRGHADAVEWLLARGARVNSDPMHWSALHYAVFAGHGEVATLLLERGADGRERDARAQREWRASGPTGCRFRRPACSRRVRSRGPARPASSPRRGRRRPACPRSADGRPRTRSAHPECHSRIQTKPL